MKEMMIQQGYVPATCTLPDEIAGPLIWSEINAGRSPCWGCNNDRAVCKGEPKRKVGESAMSEHKEMTSEEPNCPICNDEPPYFRCHHYQKPTNAELIRDGALIAAEIGHDPDVADVMRLLARRLEEARETMRWGVEHGSCDPDGCGCIADRLREELSK